MSIGKRKYKSSKKPNQKPSVKIVETEEEELAQINEEIEGKRFYQQIIRELEFGDIFVINRCFEQIIANEKFALTEEVITKIGLALFKYADSIFIPIELAQKTLHLLGRFTEVPFLTSQLQLLATNETFLLAIIHLFQHFYQKYVLQDPLEGSFSSHTCYELTMYTFLGIIENPVLLAKLLGRLSNNNLQNLFTWLGNIIPVDILYLTQEMALEILARICHVLINQNYEKVKLITQSLDERLRNALCGTKAEILTLLHDMRPILKTINEQNLNIESYRLRGMEIVPGVNNEVSKRGKFNAWLDLCAEKLCIQVLHPPSSIRVDYRTISAVNRSFQKDTILTISFSSGNKKLLGLIGLDANLSSFSLNLIFGDAEDVEAAKSFLDAKLLGLEKVEKISVASSKAYSKKIKLSTDENSLFSRDKVVLGLEISSSEMEDTISSITFQEVHEPTTSRNRHEIISMKEVNQKVNDPLLDTGVEGSKKIVPKRLKRKPNMKASEVVPPIKTNDELDTQVSGKKRKEPPLLVEPPINDSDVDTFPEQPSFIPLIPPIAEETDGSMNRSKRSRSSLRASPQPVSVTSLKSDKSNRTKKSFSRVEEKSFLSVTSRASANKNSPPKQPINTVDKENIENLVIPAPPKDVSRVSKSKHLQESSVLLQDNLSMYGTSNILNTSFYEPLDENENEKEVQPEVVVEEAEKSRQETSIQQVEESRQYIPNENVVKEKTAEAMEYSEGFHYQDVGMDNVAATQPSFADATLSRELSQLEDSLRDLENLGQPSAVRQIATAPTPPPHPQEFYLSSVEMPGLTPLHPLRPQETVKTTVNPTPPPVQRRIDPKKYQQVRFEEREEEDEGEEESADQFDNQQFSRQRGNGEEEDVFSMLLLEVAAMQKKRMKRRRSRQLSTIAANAESQLLQFIEQWFQYVDSLLYDANDGLAINLQNLLQHHLKPLELAVKELYALRTTYDRSHESQLTALQNDFQSYRSELQSYQEQKVKEKRQLLVDIEELRKSTIARVESQLQAQNQRNLSSNNRFKQKELLLRRLESI